MPRVFMWLWVYSGLLASASCLRDPPRAEGAADEDPPSALLLRDAGGAIWAHDAAPRRPLFALDFERAPRAPEQRLWLVRGRAEGDVLEDLADLPLRMATAQVLLPLHVSAHAATVLAEPLEALAAGASYDLVWTLGEEEPVVLPLRVSMSPSAGASLCDTLPGERDVRVPPNLERVLLRFDGYVHGLDHSSVVLEDDRRRAVPVRVETLSCTSLGLGAGDCASITPSGALEGDRAYKLTLGPGIKDATTAPLAPSPLSFATRKAADVTAPELAQVSCGVDERSVEGSCVLAGEESLTVRAALDEPALLAIAAGALQSAVIARPGGSEIRLRGLAPGAAYELILVARDLAGNVLTRVLPVETAYALPTIAIDEVRADPLGPEPAQEYVELLNFGPEPVQIMGFSLSDSAFDTGRSVASPLLVEPGERVLAVSPDFDPNDPVDPPIPSGVRIARLDGPLELRNDGEALFLRDELGRRISEAPALGPNSQGQCVARLGADPRRGASTDFALDPGAACTPGAPTEWGS